MEPFNQRISIRSHMPPLSTQETKLYVTHHLKLAGAAEPLLDEHALTYALFDQKRTVTAEMVLKVKNLEG